MSITKLPNIGKEREKLLKATRYNSTRRIAKADPTELANLLGNGFSLEMAGKTIKAAKEIDKTSRRRFWWTTISSVCAIFVFWLGAYTNVLSLFDRHSDETTVSLSFLANTKNTGELKHVTNIESSERNVLHIGLAHDPAPDEESVNCTLLPFYLFLNSEKAAQKLTLIFDITYPDDSIIKLADTAGYGKYLHAPDKACAFGEKTLFRDKLDRANLRRTFEHSSNRTRVVYNFTDLRPQELVALTMRANLMPTVLPLIGGTKKMPYRKDTWNGDLSQEAWNAKTIDIAYSNYKIDVFYVLDGPIIKLGSLTAFVHPTRTHADLVHNAFVVEQHSGLESANFWQTLWNGREKIALIGSNLSKIKDTEEVYNQILDIPEDNSLLNRQFKGATFLPSLYEFNQRVDYVVDNSIALKRLSNSLFSSNGQIEVNAQKYNSDRNSIRFEFIASHQFPSLFEKYLGDERKIHKSN